MQYTFLDHPVAMPSYVPPVTAWLRHGPFAMWLVKAARPRRIVELGSHYGYSYFAFCQAVAEEGITADCFSVDTWQGDDHAGFYGDNVYQAVQRENGKYQRFSTLLRKTFAEALADIEDASVDILHIDGRHSYEDVKEDFESWIPKLSDRAVVLFHDTQVTEREFGVWKLWSEIEATRPSFNFSHQHGLGVLFWGKDVPAGLAPMVETLSHEAGPQVIVDAFECSAGLLVDHAAEQVPHSAGASHQNGDDQAVRWAEQLNEDLRKARQKPGRLIAQTLKFKALNLAASLTSGALPRASERFAKSAVKRDPARDDLLRDRLAARDYSALLREWEKLRQGRQHPPADGPKISVVVGLTDATAPHMAEMIQSVTSQSHGSWELCLAYPQALSDAVAAIVPQDARILLAPGDYGADTPAAVGAAAAMASGDYLMMLGAGDMLDVDALSEIAKTVNAHSTAKLIYTDEDQIDQTGQRSNPHFKPDWNPELLYSWNYVNAPLVVEAALWKTLGGLGAGTQGAALYDLILRASEIVAPRDIRHIPKVLYHVRAAEAEDVAERTAQTQASALTTLSAHLERVHTRPIPVEKGMLEGSFRILWPLDAQPAVTIVMPTHDNAAIMRVAVESLLGKTDYDRLNLLIVDNGSTQQDTLELLRDIQSADPRVTVIKDPRPFNYSALNNAAISQTDSEIIVLLNDDVEITHPGWLLEMVALALRPDVGCVGAKLHYPDGHIQHAGIIMGMTGVAGHGHLSYGRVASGYFGRLKHRQNYSAVTGACLALRREVFDEVNGLNETDLTIAFSDVDLCLKVEEAGYRNIWTPWAQLVHHESASRGAERGRAKRRRFWEEVRFMQNRWRTETYQDPAYNPNLTRDTTDFSFAPPRWD